MLAESTVYAALFGVVVGWLTAMLLGGPRLLALQVGSLDLPTQLVISVGAGIYEELLFRVVLVGALLWAFQRLFRMRRWAAAAWAVVLGAVIFSAFHYVGALGDRFTLQSFTFRAVAGVAFSALYVTRGLGITAWTHALYDLGLTLLQA
jgi:membrane protease YdiL (CAAX protease family)